MRITLLMLTLFLGKFALCQSMLTYVPTGNIVLCDQQANVIDAHNSYLRQIKSVTVLRDASPKGSVQFSQLDSLLSSIIKNAESTGSLLSQFDNVLLATAEVKIQSPKLIPNQKLGAAPGEGKIFISPSKVQGELLEISDSLIEVKFFGLKFCNALSENGKNGIKAAESVILDLLK